MEARKNRRTCHLLIAAMLGLVCGLASFQTQSFGQGTTPEAEKGRTSAPGELQRNPKELTMDPVGSGTAVPASAEANEMERELARPPGVLSLNSQPDVDPDQAANPPQGTGQQKRTAVAGQPAPSVEAHLHLVLRISESGGVEVLSATEVPGQAVVSDVAIGNFVYEVMSDKGTLAVESMQDPFELRSFPGAPGTPRQGHHIERTTTATIVVKVPHVNLASATLDKIQVRVFSIGPGAPIEQINPNVLQRLQREGRLDLRINLTGVQLAAQVREKGRVLVPPQ
jgi:hypothetical protein